jgi:chemotaxis protein CheD
VGPRLSAIGGVATVDALPDSPIYVGIGDIVVASARRVGVAGLGSCVALGLMDGRPLLVVAHIALPDAGPDDRYAVTAVTHALDLAAEAGMTRGRIRAWLAGGAHVVPLLTTRIGERNVAATRSALDRAGVPVVAADVGGTRGRTVWFHPGGGGAMVVRYAGDAADATREGA